jgi:hypothetical protein
MGTLRGAAAQLSCRGPDVSAARAPAAGLLSRKGEAKPPPKPAVRPRAEDGRRVGSELPTDLYVRFKAYVAEHGLTGEQAIAAAIAPLIRDA